MARKVFTLDSHSYFLKQFPSGGRREIPFTFGCTFPSSSVCVAAYFFFTRKQT